MPNDQSDQTGLSDEANRLYWDSDESVNQIGEKLGLSKGVLYGMLAPLPAGLPCPQCGEEMVFPNRTAREKGFVECPSCGMEEEEAAVQAFWEGESEAGGAAGDSEPSALGLRARQAVRRAVDGGRARVSEMSPQGRIVAGTALLGIAAGLLLGAYFRKR
jgi:hypothetical protein